MKEIKYKAWLKKEYFSVLNPENKVYNVENLDFDTQQAYLSECGWYDFKDIELMQYTGLKDKNDVKIFEGYIIKTPNYKALEVVWDEKTCSFKMKARYSNTNYTHLFDLTFEKISYLEVIGNIYENPELLTT